MHRSSTATGTAGPVGASYAVVEKNWVCPSCQSQNFARRSNCLRCRTKKPSSGGGQVWHEGAVNQAAGIDHNWRECLDPKSKLLYYDNTETKKTQWNRPAEMGEAPTATGWFGRGKVGEESKLDLLNETYLKRPAPKQTEGIQKNTAYHEGMESFNIWYGKYNGDHWSMIGGREPAKSRCNISLHAGYTNADKKKPTKGDLPFFCHLFAKGLCCKGKNCKYYHRVPTYADCGRLEKDMMHDCFGRERHANHRDDMDGVGSFNSASRTLYVAGLQRTPYADKPKELEKALSKHFSEFGEVEHINVIWGKSIAFVRFRFRSHCEFAKEAMGNQALDNDEILIVRWANEDPNPVAREAIKRANADAVVSAIRASGQTIEKTAFAVPASYQVQDAKKPTAIKDKDSDDAVGSSMYYPNTDGQFQPSKKAKTTE